LDHRLAPKAVVPARKQAASNFKLHISAYASESDPHQVVAFVTMTIFRRVALAGLGLAGAGFCATTPTAFADPSSSDIGPRKHRVVVVGGGAAGLSVASQLKHKLGASIADVAIIEPSEHHYYQPSWTLTGGGIAPVEKSRREMGSVMPAGVTWIKDKAESFTPDKNAVIVSDGTRVEYDYLVVAPGIQVDLNSIKGLADTVRMWMAVWTGMYSCELLWWEHEQRLACSFLL